MNQFTFRDATRLDRLVDKFKHVHIKSSPKGLDLAQTNAVNMLRSKGYVILENYLDNSRLEYFKNDLDEKYQAGNFNYPVLAQTKIDELRDKDLIDKFLYGTPDFFKSRDLTFDKKDFKNYDQILKDFNPSTLGLNIVENNLAYFNLWLDPYLLDIVEAYMGIRPQLIEAYIRRNFPAPHRTMNHFWHRDLNNKLHLLKAFIFFTDCTIETGPHEYISKSHIDYTLNSKRYYTDEEVNAVYPEFSERRIKSLVKAGTIIIEDTRGLHRAVLPQSKFRDLGYAIFVPMPWYRKYNLVKYYINECTYKSLSTRQQKYIPSSFIRTAQTL